MPKALAFIDANIYLKLYKVIEGRVLLKPLEELAGGIIVTQQVVDEVERNKLSVAAVFFRDQLQKFNPGLSDHLFDGETDAAELREAVKASAKLKKRIERLFAETVEKISRSQDDVSIKLRPLFARAKPATPQQLERARARKERGTPPGHTKDPLGDGLHGEQILDASKGIERFWLITEDADYVTNFDGSQHINPHMHNELSVASGNTVVIRCTKNLRAGLEELAEHLGASTATIPKGEQAKEISREMSRPTFGFSWTDDDAGHIARSVRRQQQRIAALVAAGVLGGEAPPLPPPAGPVWIPDEG